MVIHQPELGLGPVHTILGNRIEDLPLLVFIPAGVPHPVLAVDMQDRAIVVGPGVVRVSGFARCNHRLVWMQGIRAGSLVDPALSSRHQIEQQLLAKGETVVVKWKKDRLAALAGDQL